MIRSQALLHVITVWCIIHVTTALKREDYRLPDDIEPIQYDLHIIIPDGFEVTKRFQGELHFSFKPKKDLASKHKLLLNKKYINVNSAKLEGETAKVDKNVGVERVAITAPDLLTAGTKYTLFIEYDGILRDSLTGLYLDSYKEDGKEVYYIATQMEPADARSVFPCLDEPALKATFKIKVTHPADYHVIGNADIQDGSKYQKVTQFKETPKMSTYLIALLVSKFEMQETEKDGLKYRILYRKTRDDMYQYALDITPKILKVLEDMTGVTYKEGTDNKILKVDQGATVNFPSYAMENWGLILYREIALLWDQKQSGTQAKKGVATTVAHELTHMWFGNLKTCKWWSVLWLNEAFAAFFQFYALAKVETTWELENQFLIDKYQVVLTADTSEHSLPMTSNEDDTLTNPQMREKFGLNSYVKGPSIVRMVMMFMGETLFYKGIKTYLKKKIGDDLSIATGPKDFWDSWNGEGELKDILPEGSDLATVMRAWTDSSGFPVVDVKRKDNQVELTTQRIMYRTATERASDNVWYVPISYTTSKNPNFENMTVTKKNWIIKLNKLTLDEDLSSRDSWIVVNLQSAAYIRINYDTSLWNALELALKQNYEQFHVLNRVQIVDDVLELSFISKLSYSTSLGVIEYLSKEVDYYPWYVALKAFRAINRRLDSRKAELQEFRDFVKPLFRNFYKSITDDNDYIPSLKRNMAKSAACELEMSDCTIEMRQKFKDFIENNKEVDPDTRGSVYCTGLKGNDGQQHWNKLYDRLDKTKYASEVSDIINALGCVENEEILKSYLEKSLHASSAIGPHDAHYALISVASGSRLGTQLALNFFISRIQVILKKYKYSGSVPNILHAFTRSIRTKEQLQQLEKLLTEDIVADHVGSIKQAIDRIRENMSWDDTPRNDFLKALRAKMPRKRKVRGTGTVQTVSTMLLCVPLAIMFTNVS